MKQIFLSLSSLLCICLGLQAQNVGVGTTTPVMGLHVSKATDTTLLLLENRTTLATGTNTGLYFKNGSFYTGAIKSIGTGSNVSRLSFFTFADGSPNGLVERVSIADGGNVGINTTAPTTALDVNGTFRLRSGSPAAGKILTSDASGNATWQSPATTSSAGAGFRAELTSPVSIPAGSYSLVNFDEDYDDAFAFNAVTGVFTAPSAGLYHFTSNIAWAAIPASVAINYTSRLVLDFAGGGTSYITQVGQQLTGISGYGNQQLISGDYKLAAGDKVHVEVSHSYSSNLTLSTNGSSATRFMGYKVY